MGGALPRPGATATRPVTRPFQAAPATASPTPEPVRVRFGFWQTDLAGDVLTALANAFGQLHPRVVVEPIRQPYATHLARLGAGAASGSGFDVALDSGPFLLAHSAGRILLDLGPLATSDHLDPDRYWADSSTRKIDGSQPALPLWVDADLLYYNRDRFAARQVAAPTDAWTWNDLLSAARALSEGKPGQMTRWGLLLVDDVPGGWGSFVTSNGGAFVDPATRKTALSSSSASEALRFVRDAIIEHHVAPRPSEQDVITRAGRRNPFLDETVAMLPGGSWLMGTILKSATFGWGVTRVPRAPRTGASAPTYAAQPVVIPRATAYPTEAWTFLRGLLEPAAQGAIAREKARLPALKEAAADASVGYATAPPSGIGPVVASLANARELQFLPGWPAWRSAVVAALDPGFDGRADFAEALQNAVTEGDRALASNGPG